MSWTRVVPLAIFVVLCGFLLFGLFQDPSRLPSPLLGQPLPEFEMSALGDPERMLTRDDLVGKVALLNVWATWCPSCRAEHAVLLELARQGVPIYGINYKDDRAAAQAWLERDGDPYRASVFDPRGRLGLDLGVYGAPETFVLDHEGVIRHKRVGVVDERVWRQEIEPVVRALRTEAGSPAP